MPIDPYSPCPGGTGKKIKFCCSDLVSELEKIQRMLEGDQRAACLEHIESIESKYPDRACLLSIKSMLQAQLGQEEKAEATLGRFSEKYPDNPVALAERATLTATKEGGVAGVAVLQDALEKCDNQIPAQVYDAIGVVAQMLLTDHRLFAARAHLVLQLGMSNMQDEQALQLLLRLNATPSVPLLVKQDMVIAPPPDDAMWKAAYTKAIEPTMRGAWRKSAVELAQLAEQVGAWPTISRSLAILKTWLADPTAIEAWRKFAADKSISLDDAVEAEAIAQSLDTEAVDLVDVLSVEYGVTNIEVLQARLAASPRALQMPIDLARMGSEDQPPPKGAYWLLSAAVPESGRDLSIEAVPRVVGQAFLYGKQTDREARLELTSYRTQLDDARAAISEIGGDALGSGGEEKINTQVPALQHALATNWRLPEDTPADKRQELISQQRREILLNRWPNMPRKIFGGKSAAEVAGNPAQHIKLLAAILQLELATDQVAEFDFNELRRKLGVAELGTIDPANVSLADLPLVRFGRVDVKKLSDEQLIELYQRADHFRHIAALRKLAHEVIDRPGLDKLDKAEVYGLLAQIEPDGSQAVGYLDKAREAAEAAKKSTAPWDLAELALRISRGEVAEADRLLHHIRNDHMREPGVAQALFQILADAGIIGPDGQPAMPPGAAAEAGPDIVVPGGGGQPGKLWTPDSDQPSGKKSALWTPD